MIEDSANKKKVEDKPPILKSWKQLYTIVLSFLALQVVIYFLFTEYFK